MSLTSLPDRMKRPMTRATWTLFGAGCVCAGAIVAYLLHLGYKQAVHQVQYGGPHDPDGLARLLDAVGMLFVGGVLAVVSVAVGLGLFLVGPRANRYGAWVLFALAAIAVVPPVAERVGGCVSPAFVPLVRSRREAQWRTGRETIAAQARESPEKAAEARQEAEERRARAFRRGRRTRQEAIRARYGTLSAEMEKPHRVVFLDVTGGFLVLDTGAAVVPHVKGIDPMSPGDLERLAGRTVLFRLPGLPLFEGIYRPEVMDGVDPAACLAHPGPEHCLERAPVMVVP